MKAYEKYKPSGVEWLGDIPEKWEVKRLKHLTILYPKCETRKILEDDLVTFTPMDCVKKGYFHNQTAEFFNASSSYNFFQEGDILLAKVTPCFENGNLAIAENLKNGFGFGSSELFVLRCKKCVSKFMYYFFQSTDFKQPAISTMYGAGGLKRVAVEFIRENKLAVPPFSVQQSIANYLDHHTARIDNIIKAKETLIDLLKEKRSALITHVVTKGLDPNAKMKPSCVDWIGDIPEGWEVKKLRYLSSMRSGESISFESISEDGNYAVYGGNGFRGFTDSYTNSGTSILIGRQGALCGNVKIVTGEIWASEHAIVVYYTPKVDPKWYFYMLSNMNLNQYSVSAAQPGLSVEQILRLKACVPTVDTQTAIVSYLDTETAKIDTTIEKTKLSIEKLKEYRTALISACVTGKIDVRGEQDA